MRSKNCCYCKNPTTEAFQIENGKICEECLVEKLDAYWEHRIDRILSEIKDKFDNNYLKWRAWFYANHSVCKGAYHSIKWYVPNDELTKLSDGLYCESCIERMAEDCKEFASKSITNKTIKR